MPFELVIKGLPKRGCLRILATLVGFDFVRPDLTLIHAPRMLFQIEHGSLLSLGAANIQLIFGVFGPLPCTGSLVSSAVCLTSSFHDSPLGARRLTNSFASRASNYIFGNWEGEHVPFHLGSYGCGLAASNKISDYSPYLAAHSGVGVLACSEVPHGC